MICRANRSVFISGKSTGNDLVEDLVIEVDFGIPCHMASGVWSGPVIVMPDVMNGAD